MHLKLINDAKVEFILTEDNKLTIIVVGFKVDGWTNNMTINKGETTTMKLPPIIVEVPDEN